MTAPSNPRADLVFLRRRIKPGRTQPAAAVSGQAAASASARQAQQAQAQQAPQTSPPRSAGLVLGRGTTPSSTSARAQKLAARRQKAALEDHEVKLLFPAPGIADVYELNLVDRVLRLSALQSSVGTMVVSGSTAIAWESVRGVTGGQTVDGHKAGTPVETSGNRELVGYNGHEALVSLRHVRELRRAIFINRSSSPMGVQLFSGDTVALPPAADGTQMVLLAHRIGNVLELRAEPVPNDWPDIKIWQEFDFSMTHRAPVSSYGR